jgi:chromosome segregation ATPase
VSAAFEEADSKISNLQRSYNRVQRDLEEKETMYVERIKVLESERDKLRKYEQRSQHLATEVEELRRKADARRDRSPEKADDGMRSEIQSQSALASHLTPGQSVSLQSQQSKIDQLQGEVYDLRRWKKDAEGRERQTLEDKAKLRRQAQALEDEVTRLRHEREWVNICWRELTSAP